MSDFSQNDLELHLDKTLSRKVDPMKLFGFGRGHSGLSNHTVLVDESSSEDEKPGNYSVEIPSKTLPKGLKASFQRSETSASSIGLSPCSPNGQIEARKILHFSRVSSTASPTESCLPELSEIDISLRCPSYLKGKVNESNISLTKDGRRKSILGKNVVYLVSDSDSDETREETNRCKFPKKRTNQTKSSKKLQKLPGRSRIKMIQDSDESNEDKNDLSEATGANDSLSDLEISLNALKKRYRSLGLQEVLENESEDSLQDDSFVVPDDEVDSSESITEESDFSVSDEESESEESSRISNDDSVPNDDSWLVSDSVFIKADISTGSESEEVDNLRLRPPVTDSEKEDSSLEKSSNSPPKKSHNKNRENLDTRSKSVVETVERTVPSSVVKSVTAMRQRTFLQSLSETTDCKNLHPMALKYISNFNKHKQELALHLFALFNREVFGKIFPEDMEIFWSTRLTHTAGRCHCKRRLMNQERWCKVELSTKILDSCDRLRDTMIHELCHAAVWIISEENDDRHGPVWRGWARKAMTRFPELPLIARCHTYEIRSKYIYQCMKCDYKIGRHSKSIDTSKMCCGKCKGKFQLMVASKLNGQYQSSTDTLKTPKAPNAFATFVKENYKNYRTPGSSHKDAMSMLSKKFAEAKISK